MFRDFAHRNARKLALMGTVENLSNGTVKVVAEGDEIKLNDFLIKLNNGPLFSRVDNVKTEWSEATNSFNDFKIVYHGFLDHF